MTKMTWTEWYALGDKRLKEWDEANDPYHLTPEERSGFEYAWEMAGNELGLEIGGSATEQDDRLAEREVQEVSDTGWTPDTKYFLAAWEAWAIADPDAYNKPLNQFYRWLTKIKAETWDEGYDSGFGDGGVNAWDPTNPYKEGQ